MLHSVPTSKLQRQMLKNVSAGYSGNLAKEDFI